jgi:hypothetical protein
MAAGPSIDVSGWLEEQLAQASPDLLRAMVTTFAEALMGAEADAVCGAPYGERSGERTNTRNGYRRRDRGVALFSQHRRDGEHLPRTGENPAPPRRRRSAAHSWSRQLLQGLEPVPVLRRGDAEMTVERPAERLGRAEPSPAGDDLDQIHSPGQGLARGLDADPLHVLTGWHSQLGGEPALQLPGAQPSAGHA